MQLKLLSWTYSFRQYERDADFDRSLIDSNDFLHVWKTDHELSIFWLSDLPLTNYKKRTDNRVVFELVGEFEFTDENIGITAKLSGILAEQNISLCFVGTFGTDYILIWKDDLPRAVETYTKAGIEIT